MGGKTFLLGQLLQKLLHLLSHPEEVQDLVATVPCLPSEADPVPLPAAASIPEPHLLAVHPASRAAPAARAGTGPGSSAEAGTQPAAPSNVTPANVAIDSAHKPASSQEQAETAHQPIQRHVGNLVKEEAALADLMVTEGPSTSQQAAHSKAERVLAEEQSADVQPPNGPIPAQSPERLSAASGRGSRASGSSKGGNTARPSKRRRSELEALASSLVEQPVQDDGAAGNSAAASGFSSRRTRGIQVSASPITAHPFQPSYKACWNSLQIPSLPALHTVGL